MIQQPAQNCRLRIDEPFLSAPFNSGLTVTDNESDRENYTIFQPLWNMTSNVSSMLREV
jgi:hypothetical protein